MTCIYVRSLLVCGKSAGHKIKLLKSIVRGWQNAQSFFFFFFSETELKFRSYKVKYEKINMLNYVPKVKPLLA